MPFAPKTSRFPQLLLMGCAFWILESLVHAVIFRDASFLDALFFQVSAHEAYLRLLILLVAGMFYLLAVKTKTISEKESQIKNILNSVLPICITNANYEIIMANDSYWAIWGKPATRPIKCHQHRPGEACRTEKCALQQIMNGAAEYVGESKKEYNNETRYFILTASPYLDANQRVTGVIESFQDITERKRLETEKAALIEELQASLHKVKLLSGLLPICASCKKIRDDKGYWNQIESYIKDHSEAEFSHGLCPDCARELYPDFKPAPSPRRDKAADR